MVENIHQPSLRTNVLGTLMQIGQVTSTIENQHLVTFFKLAGEQLPGEAKSNHV